MLGHVSTCSNMRLRLSATLTDRSSFQKGVQLLLWNKYPFTDFMISSKDRPAYPEAPWSSWSSPLELLDPGTDNFSPCGDHGSDGAQRHDLHQPVILTSKGEPLLETADKTMERLGSTASRILQCRLPWRHIARAVPFTSRKPRAHPSRHTVRHYGC